MLYTPEFCAHLTHLRRQYEAQRDLALRCVEEQAAGGDDEYVKIAQLDLDLAVRCLLAINNHLWAAEHQDIINPIHPPAKAGGPLVALSVEAT